MTDLTISEYCEYAMVTEEAFQEIGKYIGQLMTRFKVDHGTSDAHLIIYAIEMALLMNAADLAIFRKNKLDGGKGINAKNFSRLAAIHFKGMLDIDKAKSTTS